MPGTSTSTALPSFSDDQYHETDAARSRFRACAASKPFTSKFRLTVTIVLVLLCYCFVVIVRDKYYCSSFTWMTMFSPVHTPVLINQSQVDRWTTTVAHTYGPRSATNMRHLASDCQLVTAAERRHLRSSDVPMLTITLTSYDLATAASSLQLPDMTYRQLKSRLFRWDCDVLLEGRALHHPAHQKIMDSRNVQRQCANCRKIWGWIRVWAHPMSSAVYLSWGSDVFESCLQNYGAIYYLTCSTYVGNWTFRSQDHSLPGAKVPCMKLSLPGTFAPWNFRSLDFSLLGTFAPWNFRSALMRVFVRDNICLWFSKLTFSTNIFHYSLLAPTHLDGRLGLDWTYSAQRFSISPWNFWVVR